MKIEGSDQYGGLYGSYRYSSIPSVDLETVKKQEEEKLASEKEKNSLSALSNGYSPAIEDNRSKISNLEDVSISFGNYENFDFRGSDSQIGNLDVQKAVSDMEKDQVLAEYQFFVGSSSDGMFNFGSEDGTVIRKF